jgi:uncharacterized Zn ribbon protein
LKGFDFMKRILALILCVALCLSLSSCSSSQTSVAIDDSSGSAIVSDNIALSDNSSDLSAGEQSSSKDIENLIDIQAVPTLDGNICVFVTNNSDVIVPDIELQVNYLDADGNIIDLATDGHDVVLPGFTVVSRLDAPSNYSQISTEFSIHDGIAYYVNHSNSCSVSTNLGDDCVILQITNNSGVEIDEIEYVVVFYSGDNISHVGFCTDIYDTPSGSTITKKESTYGFDFDRWEVYLNQAHTFSDGISVPDNAFDGPLSIPAEGVISNSDKIPTSNDSAQAEADEISSDQRNALSKAGEYLRYTAFSYSGLIEQLEYEGFTHDESVYAADNCDADWSEQAAKKAEDYLDFSAFSRSGLIEQLEYEGFTQDESVYAADNCDADWNEQAAKKAKEYLDFSSFSRSSLIEQLEYEGFTHEQAVYGVEQNGY